MEWALGKGGYCNIIHYCSLLFITVPPYVYSCGNSNGSGMSAGVTIWDYYSLKKFTIILIWYNIFRIQTSLESLNHVSCKKLFFESPQSEMTTLEQVNNHAFIVPSNRNELVLKWNEWQKIVSPQSLFGILNLGSFSLLKCDRFREILFLIGGVFCHSSSPMKMFRFNFMLFGSFNNIELT